MRIIFMGTPEFAVPALKSLHENHEVIAVFTQPDRPSGRGHKLKPSPVKEFAVSHSLPCYQPEKLKDFDWQSQDMQGADLIVVAAYGQILKKHVLELPKYGCINIHASLLPKYRGAAPIHRAILEGASETGITIMQMEEGLDTGDMLLSARIPVGEKTYAVLHDELARMGANLLLEAISRTESGTLQPVPQDDSQSSYAHKIEKEEYWIDYESKVRTLAKIRTFGFVFAHYDGKKMKLFSFTDNENAMEFLFSDGKMYAATLMTETGKTMTSEEFLRGKRS